MIRPLTFFCVVLAGTSGLYVYTEKHQTTVLDQKISKVVQETQQIRERTSMLRAEWALLNQPDRLQSLAQRFLPQLHPLDPTQFVQLAAVEHRLPDEAPPVAAAAVQPAELAPVQVMARATLAPEPDTLSDAPRAPEVRTADSAAAGDAAADARAVQEPVSHAPLYAAATPAQPHRTVTHLRTQHPVVLAATQPARPAARTTARPTRTAPLVQMAEYSPPPLRRLIPNAGMTHPAPLPIAAWRPAQRYASAQVPAYQASSYGIGSSLGFSHAALPPPVPVQDGN
ncbi:cell division protein FtsL [Lichenicoccus sp.]|uniref:cell division protein FtsL n=1 Tax=Lichenicoccus sp. TaxID=2781899 RepID=UPI003D12C1C7